MRAACSRKAALGVGWGCLSLEGASPLSGSGHAGGVAWARVMAASFKQSRTSLVMVQVLFQVLLVAHSSSSSSYVYIYIYEELCCIPKPLTILDQVVSA